MVFLVRKANFRPFRGHVCDVINSISEEHLSSFVVILAFLRSDATLRTSFLCCFGDFEKMKSSSRFTK